MSREMNSLCTRLSASENVISTTFVFHFISQTFFAFGNPRSTHSKKNLRIDSMYALFELTHSVFCRVRGTVGLNEIVYTTLAPLYNLNMSHRKQFYNIILNVFVCGLLSLA